MACPEILPSKKPDFSGPSYKIWSSLSNICRISAAQQRWYNFDWIQFDCFLHEKALAPKHNLHRMMFWSVCPFLSPSHIMWLDASVPQKTENTLSPAGHPFARPIDILAFLSLACCVSLFRCSGHCRLYCIYTCLVFCFYSFIAEFIKESHSSSEGKSGVCYLTSLKWKKKWKTSIMWVCRIST